MPNSVLHTLRSADRKMECHVVPTTLYKLRSFWDNNERMQCEIHMFFQTRQVHKRAIEVHAHLRVKWGQGLCDGENSLLGFISICIFYALGLADAFQARESSTPRDNSGETR